jgi:hypothetical protein
MGISANRIAIWLVALVGSAAAFGQSSPVLTGAAAYGDWRSDAPGGTAQNHSIGYAAAICDRKR